MMEDFQHTLRNISLIIEQDKKSSTYKFALLRGTIEIIIENSPLIYKKDGRVFLPLGILIEKWILYYYPIFESEIKIRQTNSNNLAFEKELVQIIEEYKKSGNFKEFHRAFLTRGLSERAQTLIIPLIKKLKKTITSQPMQHAGHSINQSLYSIFNKDSCKLNLPNTIKTSSDFSDKCGYFSIPENYYAAFKSLGGLLTGKNSLLFNWALFSANSRDEISISDAISPLLYTADLERKTDHAKNLLDEFKALNQNLRCVWSGENVEAFDVDHLIPFSYWSNNDLWNLLPAKKSVNNQKSDKIVTSVQIERSKNRILDYWTWYFKKDELGFKTSFKKNLLSTFPEVNWGQLGIERLKDLSKYYIKERGYQPWEL